MFDEIFILFHFNIILEHNGISSSKITAVRTWKCFLLLVYIAVKQDFVVSVGPNKSLVSFG